MNNHTRVRRRDRLRSFAHATTSVIRQEITKYYDTSPIHSPTTSRQISSSPSSSSSSLISNQYNNNKVNSSSSSSSSGSSGSSNNSINSSSGSSSNIIDQPNDKLKCIIFPTYATLVTDDNQQYRWKIKISGWTFTLSDSNRVDRLILAAGRTYGNVNINTAEEQHFSALVNQFRCQTMKGIEMLVNFTSNHIIETVNSGPSGRFEHILYLDLDECTKRIQDKCLELEYYFAGIELPPNMGWVDVIEPTGISIISDIDDTIKVTDILDGKDAILHNTFFRKSKEVPGMSSVYQSFANRGMKVHYVSNSPWQVYPALQNFLVDHQFPKGSIHLRMISTQGLILGKPGKHKYDTIINIIKDFPERKFILIGDSGEIDPELYAKVYHEYPQQVIKIFIHDVTSERAKQADRQTALRGESLYDGVKKFISKEAPKLGRSMSSTEKAMEAALHSDIPNDQKVLDSNLSMTTKLNQFEQRMINLSEAMRYGVFSTFTLASQLLTDPVVSEEEHFMNEKS